MIKCGIFIIIVCLISFVIMIGIALIVKIWTNDWPENWIKTLDK